MGPRATPYTTEAEPEPVQVYGESKLAGERAVRETAS
ncbi:MAG: sugar nucleotide-binding protein [Halobacteriales archaeon]|nr:sugar nucleotide-binding protein [Halobacteriales archaeon]